EAGLTRVIVIAGPWWDTWWSKALLVLFVGAAISLFMRYRLQQLRKIQVVRNKIASDLHDEVGSTLSSVSLSSAVIKNKLKNGNPEVNVLLDQIDTNTREMLEAMSDIVWAVNARNDNLESVVSRMRAFANEMLEAKGCNIHWSADEQTLQTKLNMEQRKNMYLIYKEALNNVAKYSGCSDVWITISRRGRGIHLSVKDNGKGFDKSQSNRDSLSGNGIANMKARAREAGGSLEIISQVGSGTEIQLSI
ncbi:MAG: hypothetical protein JNM00_03830, partial [Flavobacteriales bacterium]|nr:hypothetical protein [Flavobacteriales bacterium]